MTNINLNKVANLTMLDWESPIGGSSNGILPKSRITIKNKQYYLKLSSYNKYIGFYGKEPLMELINSRIGRILNLPVLDYWLMSANIRMDGKEYVTLASVSEDYTGGRQSIALEKFCDKYRNASETPLDIIKRLHLEKGIYKQFVYDYIICNFDRHSRNNDIIPTENGFIVAPFFDNSATFICNRPDNEIADKRRYNDQIRVNNFIGTQYLNQNLHLIDKSIEVRLPRKEDREILFQGLGRITSRVFRDYVWDMLIWRVQDVRKENIQFILWK